MELKLLKLLDQLDPERSLSLSARLRHSNALDLLRELFLLRLITLPLLLPTTLSVVLLLLILPAILLLAALISVVRPGLVLVLPRLLLLILMLLVGVVLSRLLLIVVVVGLGTLLRSRLVAAFFGDLLLVEIHLHRLISPTTTSPSLLPTPDDHLLRDALLGCRFDDVLGDCAGRLWAWGFWFGLGTEIRDCFIHRPSEHVCGGGFGLGGSALLGGCWFDVWRVAIKSWFWVAAKRDLNSDWLLSSFFRRHLWAEINAIR